jgi:uncharacterized protein YjbJ (UPF0337 family)
MVNQQVLSGKWNEVRGKLKQRWGKLTDDDIRTFNGNVEQLVGRIQQKTGESREAIENFLGEAAEGSDKFLAGMRDRVEETVEQAADTAREGYDALKQGYADAERVVQKRPGQAVALAFGLGVLSGLGAALLLRDRTTESRFAEGHSMADRFARQMCDAFASITPESFTKRS